MRRYPLFSVSRVILFLVAIFIVTADKHAAGADIDWKFLSESNTNRWYYDTKSITPSNKNLVKVWAKGVTKDQKGIDEKIKLLKKFGGETMGYENYSYTLNLFEIDCENKKHRILSVKDYDKKGNGLQTVTIENNPWDYIAPGTIIDNLFKEICPKK